MQSKTLFQRLVEGAYLLVAIGMAVVVAGVMRLGIVYDPHLAATLTLGTAIFVMSAVMARLIEERAGVGPGRRQTNAPIPTVY